MTVYALRVSKGSFDSYVAWVCGIYDSIEKAEEAKQKYIDYVIKNRNKYYPEEKEKLDFLWENSTTPFSPEIGEYGLWLLGDWDAYNIDEFSIMHYELNAHLFTK